MIESINFFLQPIEKIIKKNIQYIRYFLIFLAIFSIWFLFFPNSTKESWEKAILVLWIILWMPILARVLWIKIVQVLMPLRKELWILMGMLAVVHGIGYLITNSTVFFQSYFWWKNGFISYFVFWFTALIFTIPLLLTSNTWSITQLWKNWKRLHRLSYLIIVLVVIHVVLLKFAREIDYTPIILLILLFLGKIAEWRGCSLIKKITYEKWQKWLCVPCGYIYDPIIGDEDSGILPGTEFTDIPNSWKCPICGVSKSDFVIYHWSAESIKHHTGKVLAKTYVNPSTIELIIEIDDILISNHGQFMSILWQDINGNFIRAYSIVKQEEKVFTFIIKLTDYWRGAKLLKEIEPNAKIRFKWIYGHFTLQNTNNPKIFIATGTWLAPIYNMILWMPTDTMKALYFTVATGPELFYIAELNSIKNLDLHIHTTKERVEWYGFWRVDIDIISATDLSTEWYLCGNPKMIIEAREKLSKRWFKYIYTETF